MSGPHAGEVRTVGDSAHRGLARARRLAVLLDSSIPIPLTKRRIGLDPLLGVIPFVGDYAGAILSGYIVLAAAQSGVPVFTLIRMILNIGVDTLVGSVPLLGDFFDAGWKSNSKNVALFESEIAAGTAALRPAKSVPKLVSWMLVISMLLALALFTFVAALIYLLIKKALFGA